MHIILEYVSNGKLFQNYSWNFEIMHISVTKIFFIYLYSKTCRRHGDMVVVIVT